MNSVANSLIRSGGAAAYANMEAESGVMNADPHELIVMLFDGAESMIRRGRKHMLEGDIIGKGKCISKAIDIVNQGLLASLDRDVGGEIAENLARIYEYVCVLLIRSNMKNDEQLLAEAEELLVNIGSAWREIGRPARKVGYQG